ncbi:hypothetical protein DV735_g3717, partial [Chaetothyriales sp. CBS 134920]
MTKSSRANKSAPVLQPCIPYLRITTVADLVYIQPSTLAALLSDPDSAAKTAVIDVRDSDHVGGHIRGSTWVPLPELEARIPELLRLNKEKDRVVFHCMLSQQRGPTAALRYARVKRAADLREETARRAQVCVLAGGFEAWRARYGEDSKLTESYAKDLWD